MLECFLKTCFRYSSNSQKDSHIAFSHNSFNLPFMIFGYARVSMQEQNLDLQMDALRKHGCYQIFYEKMSGGNPDRPELQSCLAKLQSGDTLCVWKLDRLGRSLPHLVSIIEDLKNRQVEFVSLTENLNTSTPTGKLTFYVFAALAEFVRDTTKERVMAGLAAAKARGRTGGRPHSLKGKSLDMFVTLAKDPANKPEDICQMAKISMATFYRYKQRVAQ